MQSLGRSATLGMKFVGEAIVDGRCTVDRGAYTRIVWAVDDRKWAKECGLKELAANMQGRNFGPITNQFGVEYNYGGFTVVQSK